MKNDTFAFKNYILWFIMKWESLLCAERFMHSGLSSEEDDGRTNFHRDFDRIIFSSSFRRLGKKTQVHPLAHNDHIHTRLTHSLEVASVGRSLGTKCGKKIIEEIKNELIPIDIGQILQVACLSHDIGNPPFGHAGEEAIRSWFSDSRNASVLEGLTENQKDDFKNFEGNAQGFRILTNPEHNSGQGGLRLTFASLAAMLKYPWTSLESKKIKKFGAFQSEKEYLKIISEKVGLIKKSEYNYSRHPLAFLSEAADDICYRILDLEDAHEMKILSFDNIKEILKPLIEVNARYNEIIDSSNVSDRRKMSYMRAKAITVAVSGVVDAFNTNYSEIMMGNFNEELIDHCDSTIKSVLNDAKKIGKEKIYNNARKIELEIGCYTTIGILLDAFCKAVREQVISSEGVSYKSGRVLAMMGLNKPQSGESLYNSFLKVTDYISGMTDSYAVHMARQIGGVGR